VKLVDIV
jgi:zinc and cadmium transporter